LWCTGQHAHLECEVSMMSSTPQNPISTTL
jgi:hypothetical protein